MGKFPQLCIPIYLVCITILQISQALQCYNCLYAKRGDEFEAGDPSCKSGDMGQEYLVECGGGADFVRCIKVGVTGNDSGVIVDMMERTCGMVVEKDDLCLEDTKEGWAARNDSWASTVSNYLTGYPDNALAIGCYCNDDQCNDDRNDPPPTTPPGFQCYTCSYTKRGEDYEDGDPSCATGEMGPEFLTQCSAQTAISNDSSPDQAFTQACVAIGLTGDDGGLNVTRMERMCMIVREDIKDGCREQSKDEWDSQQDPWSGIVSTFIVGYPPESNVTGCLCRESKCNDKVCVENESPCTGTPSTGSPGLSACYPIVGIYPLMLSLSFVLYLVGE